MKFVKPNWFLEYCEKTTSPCMKYFSTKHRSLIEKSFWILIFVLMISITLKALSVLVNVWINHPIVMFIENTESPIQEIPFPSIVICPSSQIRKSVWEKHMNTNSTYWNNLKIYRDKTCTANAYTQRSEHNFIEYVDYDIIKNSLQDSGISCAEIFQSDSKWQNTTLKNVCEYIQPIIGIFGLCYTINMMPLNQMLKDMYYQRYSDFFSKNITYVDTGKSNWNLENGYSFYTNQHDTIVDVTPARTNGVSYNHRLRLMLHNLDDEFLGCTNLGIGNGRFLITFSNPAEYYSLTPRKFITPDTYTKIQITPFVKKINSDLMWRSLEIRQCYLQDERQLSIFQQYTELNCNRECEINKTISMCGCVMFEGAFLGPNNIKICGPAKRNCEQDAIQSTKLPENQYECNCLPTCSMIEYEVVDTSHFDDWNYLKLTNLVTNNSRGATIEFVFKKPYFTAYTSSSILNLKSLIKS
ncbi:pickpocket protein 28-like isoform X3 [Aphis gossypii]|uniref:pickpocket protein 28-like isoform X3 n=1 Tax=Aphis gossypii TaxID=80765 RepID=UPI002158F911|nr:pickpocket protein 28-like isoform X3 [Aphis gossypii]